MHGATTFNPFGILPNRELNILLTQIGFPRSRTGTVPKLFH